MRKRTCVLFVLVAILVPLQIVALQYSAIQPSEHDLEFDYIYTTNLEGKSGYYMGYTEKMTAKGHYIVDFHGQTAKVIANVQWEWSSSSEGGISTPDEGNDYYMFNYSLSTGEYLTSGDQDWNATGLNVWFYVPGITTRSTFDILNDTYQKEGSSTLWVKHLLPTNAIKLTSEGTFYHSNVDGNWEASYTTEEYFTEEGYFIGEKYSEYNTGTNYNYAEYEFTSTIYIITASYIRPINGWVYFLAYIFPIVVFLGLFYTIPAYKAIKPRVIHRGDQITTIQRILPANEPYQIASPYVPFLNAYTMKTYTQGGKIVSASNGKGITGVGYIEPEGDIGTFFGTYVEDMVQYSHVKFAFTEKGKPNPNTPIFTWSEIEKYDVFRIPNLSNLKLDYDAQFIRPATEPYFPAIMHLISQEDYGQSDPRYAKWVALAAKTDIILVAAAPPDHPFVKEILGTITDRKFPPPDVVGGEIIMGVGFATPGDNYGWMYGLYVHPAFRNSGVGKSIVMARLAALRQMGIDNAITEIAEWNTPANKIYEKLHAEKTGKISLIGSSQPKVRVRRH